MSLTRSIKNVVKAEAESIFIAVAALLVLFTAMMDPHISAGIAPTLLVAPGIYRFVKRQGQARGYLDG